MKRKKENRNVDSKGVRNRRVFRKSARAHTLTIHIGSSVFRVIFFSFQHRCHYGNIIQLNEL